MQALVLLMLLVVPSAQGVGDLSSYDIIVGGRTAPCNSSHDQSFLGHWRQGTLIEWSHFPGVLYSASCSATQNGTLVGGSLYAEDGIVESGLALKKETPSLPLDRLSLPGSAHVLAGSFYNGIVVSGGTFGVRGLDLKTFAEQELTLPELFPPCVMAVAVLRTHTNPGTFYVGGCMTSVMDTNEALNGIAEGQVFGSSWTPLGSGVQDSHDNPGIVYALSNYADTTLYVGGDFATAGGQASLAVGQWNVAARTWTAMPGLPGMTVVRALAATGDGTFAGGSIPGRGNIARYVQGLGWLSLGAGVRGDVFDLVIVSGILLAGGSFRVEGRSSVRNLAQWSFDGGWTAPPSALQTAALLAPTAAVHQVRVCCPPGKIPKFHTATGLGDMDCVFASTKSCAGQSSITFVSGDPFVADKTICNHDAVGGNWGLVLRTVWDSAQNEQAPFPCSDMHLRGFGDATNPEVGFRLALRFWEEIQPLGEVLFGITMRMKTGGPCGPFYFRVWDSKIVVPEDGAAFFSGAMTSSSPIKLFTSDTRYWSGTDCGPNPSCAVSGPFFFASCCSVCSMFSGYFSEPRPMLHKSLIQATDEFGRTIAETCGLGENNYEAAANFFGMHKFEMYFR